MNDFNLSNNNILQKEQININKEIKYNDYELVYFIKKIYN